MDVVTPSERVLAIDVFRGLLMVGLAVLIFTPWTGWRGHVAWWGLRPSDAFFPTFLLIAGAGLALQTQRRYPWPRLVRRFVSLIVIGLLVNAVLGAGLDLASLRIAGVLQRIALVGLAGAIVTAALRRRWWAVLLAALGLTLLWGAALRYEARDCPEEIPTEQGCGTLLRVDTRLFGDAHVYRQATFGHDPEGVASTLGATATFLVGFGAIALLLELRDRPIAHQAGALAAVGVGALLTWPVMRAFMPVGKRIWSPAYIVLNAGVGLLVLAALVLVLDAPRGRSARSVADAVAWPVVAVGQNALLAWVTLFFIDHALSVTRSGEVSLGEDLLATHGHGGYLALLLGGWTAVWIVMRLAGWRVRL